MKVHAFCAPAVLLPVLIAIGGCANPTLNDRPDLIAASDMPRELQKVSLPTYRVAPPDILLISAVQNIRPADDGLEAGDMLQIRLGRPLLPPPDDAAVGDQKNGAAKKNGGAQVPVIPDVKPEWKRIADEAWMRQEIQKKFIDGEYRVQSDGTVNLGPLYGKVRVEGMTVDQAKEAIRVHLTRYVRDDQGNPAGIKDPQVTVTLPNVTGKQVISGEHLVRPDGTVALGVYGSVHVAGMTLNHVKAAVEAHLSQFIYKPEVSVDVGAYNSKVYYVITDGGGYGEQVARLPCTGNETVLDAISNIQGLSQVSSKKIWVARPSPAGNKCAQVMDVNWREITKEGITTTNYQILPGDRVYIAADHMIALDNFIQKVTAPFERIFGFTLLGHGTVRSLQFGHRQGGGTGVGGFGGGFGAGF